MKEQFVPYEIANILIDKGFNENCLGYYESRDNMLICRDTSFYELEKYNLGILAPLLQQVIDWLESKHGVAINVTTFMNAEDGKPHIKMFYVHKHPLVVQPKTFECGVSDTLKTKCDVIEYALTLI